MQFELIAEMNGWGDNERAQFLATSLSGSAVSVLTNLNAAERASYPTLVKALDNRFNDNKSEELSRVRLDNRRQLHNERLSQFGADIETLTQLAYPTAGGPARDILARERFLKGLNNNELRKQIKLSRPNSFEETLSAAIELEAIVQVEGEGSHGRTAFRREANVRQVREGSNDASPVVPTFDSRSRSRRGGNFRRPYGRERRASGGNSNATRDRETGSGGSTSDVTSAIEKLIKRVDALAERQVQIDSRRSSSVPRDLARGRERNSGCRICGDLSHWARACPQNVVAAQTSNLN
jgi:hypothetical protein